MFMKWKNWAPSLLAALTIVCGIFTVSALGDTRNVSEYNLENGMGLGGFDPVAIFPEGGGKPIAGNANLSQNFGGILYFFASEKNRALFSQNPAKYEPTYGGWCAYAMASGAKVMIQPQLYSIHGNRAHYFVSMRAKQNFDRDVAGYEGRADGFWKQISGEVPRQ